MPRLIDADALMEKLCENLRDGEVLYRIPPSAIDNAPTIKAAPQWIPVTERLPEADGEYLCYFEDGGCCAVHFDETEQAFGEWVNEFSPDTLGWCGEHFEDYQGVTHWMPLPQPPEDGGTENV